MTPRQKRERPKHAPAKPAEPQQKQRDPSPEAMQAAATWIYGPGYEPAAGWPTHAQRQLAAFLDAFAKTADLAEREACAKQLENFGGAGVFFANMLRARGGK